MEKKGLQRDMLVHMIIIIATLVILVIFWAQLSPILYGQTSVETCRTSVLAHSIGEKPLIPYMSMQCPRKFVHINNDGYKTYYADELPVDKDDMTDEVSFEGDGPSRGEIYRIIAEEMVECWYKMHEGNVQVFGGGLFSDTEVDCLICSEITFSDDFENDVVGNFREFRNFIEHEETLKQGKEQTYYDYLSDEEYGLNIFVDFSRGIEGGDEPLQIAPSDDKEINPGTKYYVFFRSITYSGLKKFLGEQVMDRVGLDVFGADENLQYIHLAESDEIVEECQILVN